LSLLLIRTLDPTKRSIESQEECYVSGKKQLKVATH